jgi:hypothetical protein
MNGGMRRKADVATAMADRYVGGFRPSVAVIAAAACGLDTILIRSSVDREGGLSFLPDKRLPRCNPRQQAI